MPTPNFAQIPTINVESASLEQLRVYVAQLQDAMIKMQRDLTYLLGNLDYENMFAVGGWRVHPDRLQSKDGDVGMSTEDTGADDIRFWAGDVITGEPAFYVTKSGKLYAGNGEFVGTITATGGLIGGWTIEADKLSGDGIIEGGTVRTAESGARVEIEDGKISIYQSNGTLRMVIDSTTSPPIINFFNTSGTLIGQIYYTGGALAFVSETGTSIGKTGQDNSLFGRNVVSSWSQIYSSGATETLQQALDDLQNQIDDLDDRVTALESP